MFIIAWPSSKIFNHPPRRSWKELDILSTTLVIAASVLFVFSFQEAGLKIGSWTSAIFIVPLVIGVLCWAALLGWEVLVARKWEARIATMFPLRLIKRRVYMGHFVTTLLGGFPYFVVIYSLPLRMQVVNSKSPLVAGIALLPMLGSVAIASTVAGAINTKRDLIFPTLLTGAFLMLIGTATLSTLDNAISVQRKMYGFEVFVGLGFGFMVSTVSLGAGLECEARDRSELSFASYISQRRLTPTAVAQGIIAQARVLGGSIGIAASTAILGIKEASQLLDTGLVTPPELSTLSTSAKFMTPAQLYAVRQTYSDSFAEGMKVCAVVSAACALATGLTYRRVGIDVQGRRKEQWLEEKRRLNTEREKEEQTATQTTLTPEERTVV